MIILEHRDRAVVRNSAGERTRALLSLRRFELENKFFWSQFLRVHFSI